MKRINSKIERENLNPLLTRYVSIGHGLSHKFTLDT